MTAEGKFARVISCDIDDGTVWMVRCGEEDAYAGEYNSEEDANEFRDDLNAAHEADVKKAVERGYEEGFKAGRLDALNDAARACQNYQTTTVGSVCLDEINKLFLAEDSKQ